MNSKTIFQEDFKDDVQWAAEFGYLNGFPDTSRSAVSCADPCHRLMIFSGLHEGACMPLKDGTYSLGRSFECDIVLKDPGIMPLHLNVICHADAITLRPELGDVHLDGQQVRHETVLPESPAVVTIAGIHFGLALEGAAWCPLDFPRIDEMARNAAAKEQGSAPLELVPSAGGGDAYDTSIIGLAKASVLSKYVPLSFILFFIVSAVFLFHVKAPDTAALTASIRKQFDERHFPKPAIQVDDEGFLDVTVYTADASKKKEIQDMVLALPATVRSHIYADVDVIRALQDYIAKMAYPVKAVYQGHGRVVVEGFVENQQEADVMEGLLKNNVMGLRGVDLQVLLLDQVRPGLLAILEKAGLADKVDLRPQTNHLLAQGALDAEESARWREAKQAMLERWAGRFDIVEQIKDRDTASLPGKIDIPIAGVTLLPDPFITLQDGKVYFKGASLKNGTVIKDIGPERIIVEVDGQEYYYNY